MTATTLILAGGIVAVLLLALAYGLCQTLADPPPD